MRFRTGNFIWTAIDYIGESAIGANGHNTPDPLACGAYCAQPFPYHISFCGDLDVVGGQKPQAYLRRVLWNNSKLEMAVHAPVAAGEKEVIGAWGYPDERQSWSWGEANDRAAAVAQAAGGMDMSVNVYSNHECVKLFLNDKQVTPPPDSGGVRMHPKDSSCVVTDRASRFTATFTVPYSPGDLTAKSYVGGVEVGNVTFTTAKQATKLRLVVDRETIDASRSDLSYVVAEVVDEAGVVVTCEDEHKGSSCSPPVVSFAVSGAGELEAVGSGDPIDPASFKAPERMTYRGRATAIVRPGKAGAGKPSAGEIKVTAKADGLGEASVTITTQ
jgi:beta-galactosidase